MAKAKDLTGQDFNYLYVIGLADNSGTKHKRRMWKCRCKCGKIVYLPTYKLTSGATISCGCIVDDMEHKSNRFNAKCISKEKNNYRARIMRYNKTYSLGRFKNISDAENVVLIAKTFTDINKFQKWILNKKENYETLKLLCKNSNIETKKVIQGIFDSFLEDLYFDKNELELFVNDFAVSYYDR